MKRTMFFTAVLGAATLCLGACDKADRQEQGSASSGTAAPNQVDAFIAAHNRLLGSFGYTEQAAKYRKADVAHATLEGEFLVDAGMIDKGIEQLKAARTLSGASAELEGAADALIGSLTKVRAHLADLSPYYTGKAYLNDKLARGRKEDPQMLAELDAADADLKRFGEMLDRETLKRDTAAIEKLKADGDILGYNRRLAMFRANGMIKRFVASQAPDPALFTVSDADAAIIDQAIAAAHAAATKSGGKDPPELHFLSSMLGSYRTFKETRRPTHAEQMVASYNHAVEAASW